MEQEKKIRREIGNSNERRRMQSINSGFASLQTLMPHREGEKLSKAAILQQTAEYIYSLEQEKTRLLSQNCQLKRLLGQTQHLVDTDETDSGPAPKRRLIDTGQKLLLEDEEDLNEVQNKLERERRTRMALEERVRVLEGQMYQGDEPQHEQQLHEQHVETSTETEPMDYNQGQTILTHAAKKHGGIETLVIDQSGRLPSIIQCAMKGDGTRVEVEQIPRFSELTNETTQAVEIASVQDPETGATRQYIVTQMCDSTSKQNLETIVEAIRLLEGDHLFSEESGPHQVVKEEVVESCIIEDNGQISNVVEMTLPNNCFTTTNIINSLPQIPGSTYQLTLPSSLSLPLSASLPAVPVASLQQSTQMIPVSVSNLVSSLQQPLPQATFLPQVPVSSLSHSLPPVSTLSGSLPSLPIEFGHIHPPQTSPVNLELGPSSGHSGSMSHTGSVTPNSELSNSPPQSSPVNLAQPSIQHLEN
eukprot:TRINITY_DN1794_c0_g1_i1.p1 TRINITY_DN1794_c0_g1~~TRINITY_DN1794_c0_g1_i1.p1  ORF type:complete len:474 (-),score=98.99 TRINITY_DN1794_c0_g1_i1:139-1560(-)